MINLLNANFLYSLSAPQLVYFWIAVLSTALFFVEIVFLFIPAFFIRSDGEHFLFSSKTVTAFLAFGGWAGFISSLYIINIWAPLLIAIFVGGAGFVASGFLFRAIAKSRRRMLKSRFAGADAVVCFSVPPLRKGRGIVFIFINEDGEKKDALTDEREAIPAGTPVKILEYFEDHVLVCRLEKTKIGSAEILSQQKIQPEAGTNSLSDALDVDKHG